MRSSEREKSPRPPGRQGATPKVYQNCIRGEAGRDSVQRSEKFRLKRIHRAMRRREIRGGAARPFFAGPSEISGGGASGMRSNVETVALQIAIQAGAADSQYLRRAQPVAVAYLQHFLDVHLAHLLE